MKWWARTLIIVLLVVVIGAGFLLPSFVSRFQDTQNDQTQVVVNTTTVQLSLGSAFTPLQKLRIVADTASSSVELDFANMDEQEAFEQLTGGLEDLFPLEVGEITFPAEGFSEVSHQIILKASGEDSLIYWEFWLADTNGNQINAVVDDDTGLILSLRYTLASVTTEEEMEETMIQPDIPLYFNRDIPGDTTSVFEGTGLYVGLEETETSAEEFAEKLQRQYCRDYLRRRGYFYTWDVDTSIQEGNTYLYSVMVVDNAGGYYVLPFTITNSEITINWT